jgi:hydrogenase expression/formation protein HypE
MQADSLSSPLRVGKLPASLLDAFLKQLPRTDPRVLIGPRLGEDAAVIDMGDRYLIITTDPVTFATDRIGWYAVHVNANDIAVMGARPRWFFATLLLPAGRTSDAGAAAVMSDIGATCSALGITVCGGHTEITVGLDRPIVVGQMLGEVEPSRLVCKTSLQVGDEILLTRGAAIEGTVILAREKAGALRGKVPDAVLDRASRLLDDPGISVVEAATTAVEAGEVHAMHDPTEGGVLTGLAELAAASDNGLRVFVDRIPIYAETRALCEAFGLDPLGLIASGALLIGAPPRHAGAIAEALKRQGIPAVKVAEVRPRSDGLIAEVGSEQRVLEVPERDEIAKAFEGPSRSSPDSGRPGLQGPGSDPRCN